MALSRQETVEWIEKLRDQIVHNHCWTCDCLQGLLVQLELDCDEDVSDLVEPLKVPRDRMHGCMGCDPCGPGGVYADYLRRHG